MTSQHGTHSDLRSEQGALRGEHPGRAKNPVVKVVDLAWLEFAKPDLPPLSDSRTRSGSPPLAGRPTRCNCAAPTPARRA